MNVAESIAILSIASRGKKEEREREREKAKEKKSKRAASFKSGMESSNSRSRYVPFRPIS